MNTLRSIIVVGLTVGALTLVGSAAAGPGWGPGGCQRGASAIGHGPGFGHGATVETRLKRMTQRLNLTEDQREQVKGILEGAQPEFEALRAKKMENRDQLHALRARSGADKQTEVQALAQSQGDTMAQMIVLRSRVHDQIDAVLSDEQRALFAQMGRHGPRGGNGPM